MPPLRVTFPSTSNSVAAPAEFNCTVPNCAYVPVCSCSTAPFSMFTNPPAELLIVPPRVLTLATASIMPVALLVSVPPWMVPSSNCNVDAPVSVTVPPVIVVAVTCNSLALAEIVPPVLVIPVVPACGPMFSNSNVAPAVASIVPVLVTPPLAKTVIPAVWLELIVPEFTSVIWPFPMCPAPEIVSWLVSVSVEAAPRM